MERNKLKAIVVDDEASARETLCLLLKEFVPEVDVVGTASDVPSAVLEINRLRPELVFLDVEMPEYDGFQISNFFREIDFEIIFVTAYGHHAIRAFELSAVAYLLKPVGIDQLRTAVAKAGKVIGQKDMQQRLMMLQASSGQDGLNKIAVPMADGLHFLELAEIVLLEAQGAYCNVFLKNGNNLLVSKKLRFFEDMLQGRRNFFRCHRSYMVNVNFLQKFHRAEGSLLMESGRLISVAREKKAEFEQLLKDLKIAVG